MLSSPVNTPTEVNPSSPDGITGLRVKEKYSGTCLYTSHLYSASLQGKDSQGDTQTMAFKVRKGQTWALLPSCMLSIIHVIISSVILTFGGGWTLEWACRDSQNGRLDFPETTSQTYLVTEDRAKCLDQSKQGKGVKKVKGRVCCIQKCDCISLEPSTWEHRAGGSVQDQPNYTQRHYLPDKTRTNLESSLDG